MRNPLSRSRPVRVRKARAAAPADPAALPLPDLRTFTIDFFHLLGAEVTPADKRKQGALRVGLPTEPAALAEHFGGGELLLAFQSVEEGSGQQLVAHGSRLFDKMLAYIERRSALTVRRLPALHTGGEALLHAVRPRNAAVANLRLREQAETLYAFHWRITYRADDKREELYTVVLDEQGAQVAFAPDAPPSFEDLLAASTPEPPAPPAPPRLRKQTVAPVASAAPAAPEESAPDAPGDGAPDMVEDAPANHAALADAPPEPPPDAPLPDGTLLPAGPPLPPLAHLVRLAEAARKFAVYHADLRCIAHEADILPRLYKALNRLTTYYGQQIEEVRASDDSGERRAALEADLERKRLEEIENHRLHVHVTLCGYAILHQPAAVAELTLSDGVRSAPVRVQLDRYSGVITRPTCAACGRPAADLILCRNGHVACDDCLRQCSGCGDVLCAACGVEPCPVCGRANCAECGSACWACGGRACADHQSRCPICGDIVCHSCQVACTECGTRQCRSHLRAETVALPGEAPRLICATCAVRCPGCRQYSARLGVCAISGQRFCHNCLVTCRACGRVVGPGFYNRAVGDGAPVCTVCAVACAGCGAVGSTLQTCAECGVECCSACSHGCAVCQRVLCSAHVLAPAGCKHVLCAEHALSCAIGGEPVCSICAVPCPICAQPCCTHHQAVCGWCGSTYCVDCVSSRSGLCKTCGAVLHTLEGINIMQEPCASSADVRALAPYYLWWRGANRAVTVYVGTGTKGVVLVVTRVQPNDRRVTITRKLNPWEVNAGRMEQ